MLEGTPTQAVTARLSDFGPAPEPGDISGAGRAVLKADASWRGLGRNPHLSRRCSLRVWRQVRARMEGIDTPVLGDACPSGDLLADALAEMDGKPDGRAIGVRPGDAVRLAGG